MNASTTPCSPEAEKALVSCMFLDTDILSLTKVREEYFHLVNLGRLYTAMVELQRQGKKIDMITLQEQSKLESDLIGDIASEMVTTASWKEYEDIVCEYHTKRQLLKVAKSIENSIRDKETSEIMMSIKNIMNSLDERDNGADGEKLLIDTISDLSITQDTICKYGYPIIDRYVGGYKEGQLIVIGGRPGFGKTAFIIELVQKILEQNIRVTVYSLEMSNRELVKRLLANRSGVIMRELERDDKLTDIANSAESKVDLMKNAMFYDRILDYTSLEKAIRRGSIINGHKIVFIDHIGLIRGNKTIENRNNWVGFLTSSLKTLAKELGIAIVILSQLNRKVEMRNDEPELSDLRDSGSIEQDADIVYMLHREKDMENHYKDNELDILIRKNRNGELAKIKMNSDMQRMRITEFIPNSRK